MEKVETAYMDDLAAKYDQTRFGSKQGLVYDAMERAELERALRHIPGVERALEVGCGSGRFLGLVKQYAKSAVGIDPSEEMLAIAEEKYKGDDTVSFKVAEGAALPFADGDMGFIYSIRTLNRVESKEYSQQMIREMFRVCESGGYLLLDFVNHNSLNRFNPNNADVLFTVREACGFIQREGLGDVVSVRGLLFFSLTLLRKTPTFLLPVFAGMDRVFSRLFPKHATRFYLFLKKA